MCIKHEHRTHSPSLTSTLTDPKVEKDVGTICESKPIETADDVKDKKSDLTIDMQIEMEIQERFAGLSVTSKYYGYTSSGHTTDYALFSFSVDSLVQHLLKKKSKISVLDIGCGFAAVLEELMRKYGTKVKGAGISGKMPTDLPSFVYEIDAHDINSHVALKAPS
jgi:SAM-dependent methyltransferase